MNALPFCFVDYTERILLIGNKKTPAIEAGAFFIFNHPSRYQP